MRCSCRVSSTSAEFKSNPSSLLATVSHPITSPVLLRHRSPYRWRLLVLVRTTRLPSVQHPRSRQRERQPPNEGRLLLYRRVTTRRMDSTHGVSRFSSVHFLLQMILHARSPRSRTMVVLAICQMHTGNTGSRRISIITFQRSATKVYVAGMLVLSLM